MCIRGPANDPILPKILLLHCGITLCMQCAARHSTIAARQSNYLDLGGVGVFLPGIGLGLAVKDRLLLLENFYGY